MGKLEKKKTRLKERIKSLEDELLLSLTKKDSNTAEINVGSHQRKIQEARTQLQSLK